MAHLQELRRRHPELRDDLFIKVGDSITASHDSLRCLSSSGWRADHPDLSSIVSRFAPESVGGIDPFRRASRAAGVGWSARTVAADACIALRRELQEVRARFALVQLGTNDVEDRAPHVFADFLLDIVDWLLARGVIPILFTPPPRRDRAESALWVLRYGAIIRAVAQSRQVPLVDYHRALRELPRYGLAKDGIHPSTFTGPHGREPCSFLPASLRHGYNVRNLLAIQALGRVAAGLLDGAGPSEVSPAAPAGAGSSTEPFLIPDLPFVDTLSGPIGSAASPEARSGSRVASTRATCTPPDPLTEAVHYQFRLVERARVHALEFDRTAEVDLLLLDGAGQCWSHERVIERYLDAGSYELLLVPRGSPRSVVDSLLVVSR